MWTRPSLPVASSEGSLRGLKSRWTGTCRVCHPSQSTCVQYNSSLLSSLVLGKSTEEGAETFEEPRCHCTSPEVVQPLREEHILVVLELEAAVSVHFLNSSLKAKWSSDIHDLTATITTEVSDRGKNFKEIDTYDVLVHVKSNAVSLSYHSPLVL